MQHAAPSLLDILNHIPLFVWAILAAILAMGFKLSRATTMATRRVVILPIVWLVIGLMGVRSGAGLFSPAGGAWALGLLAGAGLVRALRWPGQVRYDVAERRFHVPGSWIPMGLMLSIFVLKAYAAMTLAVHPAVAHQLGFAVGTSAAFGFLSGCFLGRSLSILSARPRPAAAVAA
ncbi:DUF6622 family protein [Mitsuaria sp. GD03876]|uniref:DUF6622 family protein n=1 Tax=Mitsuaria sp. GD03876 TaxID=2975399 RepID=UPI00244BA3B1|nr:DUF6622 family protein [Mitsuaria sp. GD03876]MDH0866216.1 hypothetical protein [Mitsuaria sp. GD03876]